VNYFFPEFLVLIIVTSYHAFAIIHMKVVVVVIVALVIPFAISTNIDYNEYIYIYIYIIITFENVTGQWSANGVKRHTAVSLHGIRCASICCQKLYFNINICLIKLEILICPDSCLPRVRGRLRSVSPSPILLIGLHSTGCKCKLTQLKDLLVGSAVFVATFCFYPFP
jgi:hypothetical protein